MVFRSVLQLFDLLDFSVDDIVNLVSLAKLSHLQHTVVILDSISQALDLLLTCTRTAKMI